MEFRLRPGGGLELTALLQETSLLVSNSEPRRVYQLLISFLDSALSRSTFLILFLAPKQKAYA